jgi:hypothetical protein
MLSLVELQNQIFEYREGHISIDDFLDWYRRASRGKFGAQQEVLDACLRVDIAVSALEYDGLSDAMFQDGLENAIRPLVAHNSIVGIAGDSDARLSGSGASNARSGTSYATPHAA